MPPYHNEASNAAFYSGLKSVWHLSLCLSLLGITSCLSLEKEIGDNASLVQAPQDMQGQVPFLITPFEDKRPSIIALGTWRNPFNHSSPINLFESQPSHYVSLLCVETIRSYGLNAQLIDKDEVSEEKRHIKLSGKLLALWIEVDGGLFSASISVRTKIALRADNQPPSEHDDYLRMTINGMASDRRFWATKNYLRGIVESLLQKSFDRFISEVEIKDNALRLK